MVPNFLKNSFTLSRLQNSFGIFSTTNVAFLFTLVPYLLVALNPPRPPRERPRPLKVVPLVAEVPILESKNCGTLDAVVNERVDSATTVSGDVCVVSFSFGSITEINSSGRDNVARSGS